MTNATPPGWYLDPGGQQRTLRYWDGRRWTASTRPEAGPTQASRSASGRRGYLGWLVAAGAAVVAVIVLAVLAVRALGGGLVSGPGSGPGPPSAKVCPDATQPTATLPPPAGDRVLSGKLSYPRLGLPFGRTYWDRRVPFGHDVQGQQATVEQNASGEPTWVAAAIVARLLAGDGFYGPEQGAEVVADCVTSRFYGNAEVQRTDRRNEALIVDGREAYLIESHLTFRLPNIQTTGETMIIVVVDVAEGEGGLFYGSVPDTSPQLMEPVRAAMAGLQVEG